MGVGHLKIGVEWLPIITVTDNRFFACMGQNKKNAKTSLTLSDNIHG
jgi:hypothetical protein